MLKRPEPNSKIEMIGCQLKSIEAVKTLAKHLDAIEKTIGICEVEIKFSNGFICPDISEQEMATLQTPMEKIMKGVILSYRESVSKNKELSKG